jgi:hypothetical protein
MCRFGCKPVRLASVYKQYVGFGVFLCDEKLEMCYSIA